MENLLKPASGTNCYSITWARSIVDQLAAAHARATEAVLEFYDISLKDLALYLAKGDPVFTYLKKRIKYISRQMENQKADATTIQLLSDERHYVALNAPESARQRLDARINSTDTQEAGFKRAEPGRSEAETGRHPWALFQLLLFPTEKGETRELYAVGCLPTGKSRHK